jgi:hypothetical protein
MTALAAGVALLPLLIDAATPGKEILHPVAVTIFGGLISATLLDALLTPVLFLRFDRSRCSVLSPARDPAGQEWRPHPRSPKRSDGNQEHCKESCDEIDSSRRGGCTDDGHFRGARACA